MIGGRIVHAKKGKHVSTTKTYSDRAIDILLRKALGRGAKHGDLGCARGKRRLESLQIRCQHWVGDARAPRNAGHHLRIVAHLRHPLGTHKAGRLDVAQPGGREQVDEGDLGRGGHNLFLVLQTVARSDLDDAHVRGARRALWVQCANE